MCHSYKQSLFQVALKLYDIARTDLVKLQDALQNSGFIGGRRPKGDVGWKVLFPEGLDGKTPITEADVPKSFKTPKAERAKYNPMLTEGMTDADIYQAVHALFPVLGQTRSKLNLDRRNGNSSIRALVVTSVPFNRQSAFRTRDWTCVVASAVAEPAFVKQYRQELFCGPAGAIRLMLSDIFDRYTIPSTQANLAPGGSLVQDRKFAWCDKMIVKDADTVLEHTREIDSGTAASNISQQDAIRGMKAGIQRLVNMWENSVYAHNTDGPTGSVDSSVASILSDLVKVFVSVYLSFHLIYSYLRPRR
jgi:hypothetical protein